MSPGSQAGERLNDREPVCQQGGSTCLPPLPSPPTHRGRGQLCSLPSTPAELAEFVLNVRWRCPAFLEPPLGLARSDLASAMPRRAWHFFPCFPLLEHMLEPTIRSHKMSYLYPVMLFFLTDSFNSRRCSFLEGITKTSHDLLEASDLWVLWVV